MRMTHASMIIMAIVYLLLISSCLLQWSSGTAFNPVVYDTKAPLSSQCGQSDPFEDDQQLMEALKMAQQQLPPPGCNPPPNMHRHSSLQLICLLRLLPDPGCQWLTSTGLL